MKMRARSQALVLFYPSSSSSSARTRSFLSLYSSLSSSAITPNSNSDSSSSPSSALIDCLTNAYKFTKPQALSISNRFSSIKSPNTERPESVHKYFRELGLSETQIRTVILLKPQILFSHANKTLKPKVDFFKDQLGVETCDLRKLISGSPSLLTRSLNKNVVPIIQIIKKILGSDENSKEFIRVLSKFKPASWPQPNALLANSAILESYGIVGPRLSLILKTCPYIFLMEESKLRDLISKVLDMGFPLDSRMIHHALHTVGGSSNETLKGKLDLLSSFGFSESECLLMFRRAPVMLSVSKEKLKFGIDFFLNTVKFRKSILISSPYLLMFGMEKRVIPRYNVLQVLKLKKLFEKEPSFCTMLCYNEADFLEKFVLRFKDDKDELLEAYKGHISVPVKKKKPNSSVHIPRVEICRQDNL